MSLFDILKKDDLGEMLGALVSKGKAGVARADNHMPGGMGGLLGAGTLGVLLGSVLSRTMVKNTALLGAGAVAWSFYRKWAAGQSVAVPEKRTEMTSNMRLADASQDPTAMLLLRAMVFAARADGHIDAAEEARIGKFLPQMFPGQDTSRLMQSLMQEPLDPAALAAQVGSVEQGEDLYRLSCLIMDVDHFMERSYLDGLAQSLRISADRKNLLEQEAAQARQQLAALD